MFSQRLPWLLPYIKLLGPWSAVDYGCGRSAVAEQVSAAVGCSVERYDPAIPEYATRPHWWSDLLINIDVLEHIEEPDIDATLRDMASLAAHAIVVIDTRPATTLLPDGRNAHVTLRAPEWWRERLRQHYPVVEPVWVWKRPAAFITWRASRGERARIRIETAAAWLRLVARKATGR